MFSSNTSQVSNDATYIEDVFSTYLYTGTGSDQTLTTGVDLSTYGGMIWSKRRSAVENHFLQDTNRGLSSRISSNTTGAAATTGAWPMNAVSTTGMTVSGVNYAAGGETYASWTFRKQPKFFDVVTYTGTGSARTIAHNLGSAPGCIFVKSTSSSSYPDWLVYHRSLGSATALSLNSSGTGGVGATFWNNTAPTSTVFSLGDSYYCNEPGTTYVAYLFAHNAGGFGLTGTDNVISCGSFTTNASGGVAAQNLGYEPQFIIYKCSSATEDWRMLDNMRGMWVGTPYNASPTLYPNLSNAENNNEYFTPTATGFSMPDGALGSSATYIYIAIRRGPMKTPTSGTSVFAPATRTGNDTSSSSTAGFPVDLGLTANRGAVAWKFAAADRLRGATFLRTAGTNAEGNPNNEYTASSFASNTQLTLNGSGDIVNANANTYIDLMFQRAPGFFDEVCYTGTGTDNTQITHNLGVAPELIITKKRSSTGDWWTLCTADAARRVGRVNLTNAFTNSGIASIFGNGTSYVAPTASVFTLGSGSTSTNTSGATYVAYLFASCPGVSKVGSYTGTGATQTINCGFTGGARFVMIKRTDTTSDWFVWDTARGMVAGTDPSLSLNTTAAEVNANSAYTNTGGFQLLASPAADINTNGGTYIYLAIA